MQFNITTRIGDRTLAFREPISDPFVRSTTYVSRWDRFKSLFTTRRLEVTIIIDADKETVFRVMNLDRGVFPVAQGTTHEDACK